MRAGRWYICIFINLVFSCLHAQEYLRPELLTVENGLLSRNVNSVIIDRQGFLWAGTNFGLNRYNGYRFRSFFTSNAGNGYPGIQVTAKIRTDSNGDLWVLNSGGFNHIESNTGEISRYPVASFDNIYERGSVLVDLYSSTDGNIWILSDRSLTLFSTGKTFTTWLIPAENLKGAKTNCIAADARGNVWIGTNRGILLFSVQQKLFKEIVGEGSEGLLSNNEVRCLYLDADNYLWVGTRNGLNHIDPVDYEFYKYFPGDSRSGALLNSISDITTDNRSGMFLATDGGIIAFNPLNLQFRSLFESSDTVVNSVATDESGNLWAATDRGILKIRKSRLPVINLNERTPSFRLADNHITSLMADDAGNKLFIGYYHNGFSALDTRTFSGSHLNTLDGSPVAGFYPFRDQEFLIASGHEIEVFTPAARRSSILSVYPFMNKSLLQNSTIKCLYYDGTNTLWIGTTDGIQYVRLEFGPALCPFRASFSEPGSFHRNRL